MGKAVNLKSPGDEEIGCSRKEGAGGGGTPEPVVGGTGRGSPNLDGVLGEEI